MSEEFSFEAPKPPKEEEEKKNDKSEYIIFADERIRQDVYLFCKGLASYMAEGGLQNVAFIDRGARAAWIGVNEYWNMHYKDLPKPSYFFVNPDGFDLGKEDLEKLQTEGLEESAANLGRLMKREKEIVNQFLKAHPELMKRKKEPLVLFDTCSHSGYTLRSVNYIFSKLGFQDIRIITAHSPDDTSGIEADKDISEGEHFKSCYPFGHASGVKKGENVVSERDKNEEQSVINEERREIKQIIHDGENKTLELRTIQESFSAFVDTLLISEKGKKVLKSIVEKKRSGTLTVTDEETGISADVTLPKETKVRVVSRDSQASALVQAFSQLAKRKLSISFSED